MYLDIFSFPTSNSIKIHSHFSLQPATLCHNICQLIIPLPSNFHICAFLCNQLSCQCQVNATHLQSSSQSAVGGSVEWDHRNLFRSSVTLFSTFAPPPVSTLHLGDIPVLAWLIPEKMMMSWFGHTFLQLFLLCTSCQWINLISSLSFNYRSPIDRWKWLIKAKTPMVGRFMDQYLKIITFSLV